VYVCFDLKQDHHNSIMSTSRIFTRRQVARSFLAAGFAGGLTSSLSAQAPAAKGPAAAALPPPKVPKPSLPRPTLHVYSDYGWLRGFNYIAPWGARVEDAWWFYDGAKMRADMALARSVHANTIRLWIEYTAWFRDPEGVTANFLDAIAAIDENGMKAMPCLFNRWHNPRFDYGGTHIENLVPAMPGYADYVRALVAPLVADARVLCWDLCNEPQGCHDVSFKQFSQELSEREYRWLMNVAETLKQTGAQQPVTIGTMNLPNIAFYSPLVDVLCAHPYPKDRAGLEKYIAGFRNLVNKEKKPLLVNECVPGSDVDAVRGETHRYYWELLSAAGYGCMPWSLREGISIAARRDRMDGNGIDQKGYHPTFNVDGTLRAGHEWMRAKPKLRAPWEKT
jgi:hypothetical protein